MKYKFNVNIKATINTDEISHFEQKFHYKIIDLCGEEDAVMSYHYKANYEEIYTKEEVEMYNKALNDVLEAIGMIGAEDYCMVANKIDDLRKAVEDND